MSRNGDNIRKLADKLVAAAQKKNVALTRGLKRCGLVLAKESNKLVPVDTGVLRASQFVRVIDPDMSKVVVEVGFTAKYAIHVHEDLDKAHGEVFNIKYAAELAAARAAKRRGEKVSGPYAHSRKPDEQAKFLETPFRVLLPTFLTIIKSELSK